MTKVLDDRSYQRHYPHQHWETVLDNMAVPRVLWGADANSRRNSTRTSQDESTRQ